MSSKQNWILLNKLRTVMKLKRGPWFQFSLRIAAVVLVSLWSFIVFYFVALKSANVFFVLGTGSRDAQPSIQPSRSHHYYTDWKVLCVLCIGRVVAGWTSFNGNLISPLSVIAAILVLHRHVINGHNSCATLSDQRAIIINGLFVPPESGLNIYLISDRLAFTSRSHPDPSIFSHFTNTKSKHNLER